MQQCWLKHQGRPLLHCSRCWVVPCLVSFTQRKAFFPYFEIVSITVHPPPRCERMCWDRSYICPIAMGWVLRLQLRTWGWRRRLWTRSEGSSSHCPLHPQCCLCTSYPPKSLGQSPSHCVLTWPFLSVDTSGHLLFLWGHQSYWIRILPLWPNLTLII